MQGSIAARLIYSTSNELWRSGTHGGDFVSGLSLECLLPLQLHRSAGTTTAGTINTRPTTTAATTTAATTTAACTAGAAISAAAISAAPIATVFYVGKIKELIYLGLCLDSR